MEIENNNENIVLRALEPYDVDLLYEWENDTEIWRLSNTITPFSKYILQKYIDESHLDVYQTKQLRLMIDIAESGTNLVKTIGTVDLFDFDPFHNRAGVGILIGEKGERKKGYASLALSGLIEYAFEKLQLHQLYCNIIEDNKESLKLFEKQGFKITGLKKDWIKIPGGYSNVCFLQLMNKQISD